MAYAVRSNLMQLVMPTQANTCEGMFHIPSVVFWKKEQQQRSWMHVCFV